LTLAQCVTVEGMGAMALREHAQVEQAIDLADSYAAAFVAEIPYAPSEEALRRALAGTLLSFMAEVLVSVSEHD
jgi:hypothetical protein